MLKTAAAAGAAMLAAAIASVSSTGTEKGGAKTQ